MFNMQYAGCELHQFSHRCSIQLVMFILVKAFCKSSGPALVIASLNPKVSSILPCFNCSKIASIKSIMGIALLCIPLPPRSVFIVEGISSITSILLDFINCRRERVNECKKDFVAEYTGILMSGTKDNPEVTLIIVSNDFKLIKSEAK